MKLLLENWREFLKEAAKSTADLPEGVGVTIQWFPEFRGGTWSIIYSDLDHPTEEPPHGPSGEVVIDQQRDGAGCEKVWQIHSDVESGWGPMLYDIAMEWATLHGDGLMPDRAEGTSDDAKGVWEYYLHNRSDVTAHQLDDLSNTLTPTDDTDNCKQHQGIATSWYDLDESPLSKRYTKEPTTLQNLKKSGRLTIIK